MPAGNDGIVGIVGIIGSLAVIALPRALTVLFALAPLTAAPAIETHGNIQRLVEQHDVGPKVALATVLKRPHAYAVGSLAELRGEITILDGTAWLAVPPQAGAGAPRVTEARSSDEQAAFLAVAYVDPARWQKVALAERLSSDTLDEVLAKLAADRGLRGRDFPFRVDGRFATLTLAIVDGRRVPPGPGTEATLAKANVLQREADVDGSLVGFYSTSGNGAFTHAGAHSHVHAVVPRPRATGHAQKFELAAGAMLFLPAAAPP